ncbi:hypothetical protein [Streptomyces otsuchiensis]|nr:hypothetical protein [Streptomyces otsuchiensis]
MNDKIWAALDELAGVDLLEGPGEYLHGVEDISAWLAEFTRDDSS